MLRATCVYTVSAALMTVYGGQVCPYIEGIGLRQTAAIFAGLFGMGLVVRWQLVNTVLRGVAAIDRPRYTMYIDATVFIAMAGCLSVYNAVVYGFPFVSAGKLTLGFATLGLFLSLDLALAEQRRVAEDIDRATAPTALANAHRPTSLGRRLTGFAVLAVSLAFLDVVLVVNKDLDWLAAQSAANLPQARVAVLGEVLFIGLVLLGLTVNAIVGYARNVSILLRHELSALESVRAGTTDCHVPVITRDEFGQIAAGTNEMIRQLERNRELRDMLGKFVGGTVADYMLRQLERDRDVMLGGTRQRLVIMIADVRDFTTRCESQPPERVVRDLNLYFSHIVPIVEQHGGIIDKFIGDGIMAVFGLDGRPCATDRALACAKQMVDTIPLLNDLLHEPIRIGVGIARGEVVLGNVGSPERLEFTAIGNPVNLAARLEALTKTVDIDIALDEFALEQLSDKSGLRSCGHHNIKGRSMPVPIFGWQGQRRGQRRITCSDDFSLGV